MIDPFTQGDDLGIMGLSQIQSRAEQEMDFYSTNQENTMSEPSAASPAVPATSAAPAAAKKKVIKKTVAKPAAAPAKKPAAKKTAPAKPAAKKKTDTAPRGRSVPEGYTGLDTLAKELKTEPGALRRKLRRSDLEKPESGVWAWKDGSRDLANVRKLLSAE